MYTNRLVAKVIADQFTSEEGKAKLLYQVPSGFHFEGTLHISRSRSVNLEEGSYVWMTIGDIPQNTDGSYPLTTQERFLFNYKAEGTAFQQIENIHMNSGGMMFIGAGSVPMIYFLMGKLYNEDDEQLQRDYRQSQINKNNHLINDQLVVTSI